MSAKNKQLEKKVWDRLATVIDPELGLDIVSLGLIYGVKVSATSADAYQVTVDLTLTTAGCPLAGVIRAMVVQAVVQADPRRLAPDKVQVNLVFDPPWTPDMMSQEAKTKLKFML